MIDEVNVINISVTEVFYCYALHQTRQQTHPSPMISRDQIQLIKWRYILYKPIITRCCSQVSFNEL